MGSTAADAPTLEDRKARLIVAVGLAVSAAILSAWLVVWLIYLQTDFGLEVFAFGGREAPPVNPSISFQERNIRAFHTPSPNDGRDGVAPCVEALRAYLKGRFGRPSIVYLSAPGYRGVKLNNSPAEALLAAPDVLSEVLPEEESQGVNVVGLKAVLDAFLSVPGKRLLILDVVRVGADRDLGVFDDDVAAWLKDYVETSRAERPGNWDGFAIFCASAPGQWNWSSDADGRSVFSHYVVEALGKGRDADKILDNGDLAGWVAGRVHDWVRDHRGAVQVPIVLGDTAMRFPLPRKLIRRDRGRPDRPDPEDLRARREQLSTHYRRQVDYQRQGIPVLSPIAWRDYRTALLRAERFYRASRPVETGLALHDAEEAEKSLLAMGEDRKYPSLALSLKSTTDPKRRDALDQANSALKALAESLPDDHPPEPKAGKDPKADLPPSLTDVIRKGSREKKKGGRQEFSEGQLIDWSTDFVKLLDGVKGGIDQETWLDPARVGQVGALIQLRQFAESVASCWHSHPWLRRLVEQGDNDRRAAQDQLFAGELAAEAIHLRLETARTNYQAAQKIADAIELSYRVEADLPFLGAWYVRHQARLREKIDGRLFEKIAESSIKLNALLDTAYDPRNDPPLAELEARSEALAQSFGVLATRFREECNRNDPRWRVVDDLLSVPGIDPELRETLVDRSLELANRDALEPPPAAVPVKAEATTTTTGPNDLIKKGLKNDLRVRDMAQTALDGPQPAQGTSSEEWTIGDRPQADPDPSFTLMAAGLGLLDWCILRVGSAFQAEEDLVRLKETVDKVLSGSGGAISPRVRGLRRHLAAVLSARVATLAEPVAGEAWWADRVALERARLSLPASFGERTGGLARDIAELRLGQLLTWQADRLMEDLDFARADSFLKRTPEVFQRTDFYHKARDRYRALNSSVLAVLERAPAGEMTLREAPLYDLTLELKTRAELPAGEAAFVVGGSDDSRLLATADVRSANRWGSELVAVGGSTGTARATLKIHRTEYDNGESVQASLNAAAFFRGLTFRLTPEMIPFRLLAVKNTYLIRIKTTDFARAPVTGNRRKLIDQHDRHPGDCYLHTGARHSMDLVLTYRPAALDKAPRAVKVTATVDGKATLPETTWVLDSDKPSKLAHLPIIRADDVLSGESGSLLRIEVRDAANGTLLNSREIKIHQVDTSRYYEAIGSFENGIATLKISRVKNDPISAEEFCAANVPEGELLSVVHSVSKLNDKTGPDDGFPEKVPLLQGEHVVFRFLVNGLFGSMPTFEASAAGSALNVKVQMPKPPLGAGLPTSGSAAVPGVP